MAFFALLDGSELLSGGLLLLSFVAARLILRTPVSFAGHQTVSWDWWLGPKTTIV